MSDSDPLLKRTLRYVRSIDEKLDLVLTGHGERIDKLETVQAKHEKTLADHRRLIRWLCKKVERRERR
jgi:hypothetical protein